MCVYYLYEKYYKPIIGQYCIADCVSWVPRLTLLDLPNALSEQNLFVDRGLTIERELGNGKMEAETGVMKSRNAKE